MHWGESLIGGNRLISSQVHREDDGANGYQGVYSF